MNTKVCPKKMFRFSAMWAFGNVEGQWDPVAAAPEKKAAPPQLYAKEWRPQIVCPGRIASFN